MSSAGHMQSMINTFKANRAMLASQRKKNRTKSPYHTTNQKNRPLRFKKLSSSALLQLKAKIRDQAQEKTRKEKIVATIAFVLTVSLLIILLFGIKAI